MTNFQGKGKVFIYSFIFYSLGEYFNNIHWALMIIQILFWVLGIKVRQSLSETQDKQRNIKTN